MPEYKPPSFKHSKPGEREQVAPSISPAFDPTTVYTAPDTSPNISILNMGEWGVGKTRLLGTARLPILIYMFDPNGAVVLHSTYPELIADKMIQVVPCWGDSFSNVTGLGKGLPPHKYIEWEQLYDQHVNSGYLSQFGTVALDSFTSWMVSAGAHWLYQKNQTRKGTRIDQLAQGDYNGLYNLTRTLLNRTQACNCDFIINAHLEIEKNELTSEIRYVLATYNRLQSEVPPMFTEKWVMLDQATPNGVSRYIITQPTGLYRASTQLGTGVWEAREEPNICKMLEKINWNTKPKPKFWEK